MALPSEGKAIVAAVGFDAFLVVAAGSAVAFTAKRYSMSPSACRVADMPAASHSKSGGMPALSSWAAIALASGSAACTCLATVWKGVRSGHFFAATSAL